MSDLTATNCGCNDGCGCGNSIIWIILLLCCCGGNNGSAFSNNGCGCGGNNFGGGCGICNS